MCIYVQNAAAAGLVFSPKAQAGGTHKPFPAARLHRRGGEERPAQTSAGGAIRTCGLECDSEKYQDR